jgi:hypothetical protein
VSVGVEVGGVEIDAEGRVAADGDALVDDAVVHAASRNAIEQK